MKAIPYGNTAPATASGTVTLSDIETVGVGAFSGCTALETLSLPAAKTIRRYAFCGTGSQTLEITLGGTAPTLGINMFYHEVSTAKTVIVKVPAGATGYADSLPVTISGAGNTVNWGNGFRGKGRTGSAFSNAVGTAGSAIITLTIGEM